MTFLRAVAILLVISGAAFGQCGATGRLILNPLSGLLDCTGSIGAGTGDALVANPLSQFAATTSAQLKATISDENGAAAGAKAIFAEGILNITAAKTVAFANSINFTATDAANVAFGAGGTVFYANSSLILGNTPLTTRGDLFIANTATPVLARLAKGTQYQTLQGGAADLLWDALHLDQASAIAGLLPLANGGTNCATPYAVNPQTGTYQVLAADFTCSKTISVASGTFTITLVASGAQPVAGSWIRILNYGSGVVTVARSGQNINGATTSHTLAAGSATAPTGIWVASDATNYFAQPIIAGAASGVATLSGLSGTVTMDTCFGVSGNEITFVPGCLTGYFSLSANGQNITGVNTTINSSATEAAFEFVPAGIPSSLNAGGLGVYTTGPLYHGDGANVQFHPSVAGSGNTAPTAPTTGTIVKWGAVFTQVAATVGTDYGTPDAITKTYINTTIDTEGTGNVVTVPEKVNLIAGGCQNTTASSFWDLPTATPAVAACVTGTNTQKGVLDFADTSGGFSAQSSFLLPADFSGAVDARIIWFTSATTGNAKWSLSTICTAVAASETDDPAFNTASTVTTAAPGTANRLQVSAITGVTTTGCAAGEVLHIKIFRDGNDGADTIAATARLQAVELTIRRAL